MNTEKITHYDVYEEYRTKKNISLDLVPYYSKILNEKTQRFDFDNPQVDPYKLKDKLIATMFQHGGIGIAANQVGINLSVFVLRPDLACFNPKIIEYSEETVLSNEGCLSYPLLYLPIKRSRAVLVSFYDENGKEIHDAFEGLTARCFQHEYDHINGVNYQMRCDTYHRNRATKKWKKFMKDEKRAKEIIANKGTEILVSEKRNFDSDKEIFTYSA